MKQVKMLTNIHTQNSNTTVTLVRFEPKKTMQDSTKLRKKKKKAP